MSGFDAADYFSRKVRELRAEEDSGVLTDKRNAVLAARERAIAALDNQVVQARKIQEAQQLELQSSWAGKLGLDPNGVAGGAVNLGAQAFGGIHQMVGWGAGLALGGMPAAIADMGLTEQEKTLIGKYRQGTASPEEVAFLNRPARRGEGVNAHDKQYTPLQLADAADAYRKRSTAINQNADEIAKDLTYDARTDALQQQLGDGFADPWERIKSGASALWSGENKLKGTQDLASGVADLVYLVGESAGDNPQAVLELVAQNLPQVFGGALGAAGKAAVLTSNIGMASDAYQKGILKYQAENGGAYPEEGERRRMAAWAASIALAEQASDMGQLALARGANKLSEAAKAAKAAKAAGTAVGTEAAEALAKFGVLPSVGRTAGAAVAGFAGESITEGFQTVAEGEASLKPASAQDVFVSGALGGMVGASISGGGRGLGEALKATPEHAADRKAKADKVATGLKAYKDAADTGNVDAFLDPKSKTYNPAQAIEALAAYVAKADTAEEARTAAKAKASSIVASLADRAEAAQRTLAQASDPAAIADQEKLLAEATARGDAVAAEEAQFMLDSLQEDAARVPELQKAAEAAQNRLGLAQQQLQTLMGEDKQRTVTSQKAESFQADVEILSAPVTQGDAKAAASRAQAAERIINLSMSAPAQVDVAAVKKLAKDQGNGLSGNQRTYLNAFAEAQGLLQTLKSMEGVNKEVFFGGNGNLGLDNYRDMVAAAIKAKDSGAASQALKQLAKFRDGHRAKAAAFKAMVASGNREHAVRKKDGGWTVVPAGRQIDPAHINDRKTVMTPALAALVGKEAVAAEKVFAELRAAYAVHFSPNPRTATPQQGATPDVSHVPQAHTQSQAPAAQAPKPPASASPDAGTPATGEGGSERGTAGRAQPAKSAEPVGRTEQRAAVAAAPASPPAQSSTQESEKTATEKKGTEKNSVESQKTSVDVEDSTDSNDYTSEEVSSNEPLVPQESSEKTSEEETQSAVISALNEKTSSDTPYRDQKLGDFYVQNAGKEGVGGSLRPLAAVKNLLTQTARDISEFIKGNELSEEGTKIWKTLRALVLNKSADKDRQWGRIIDANLKKQTPGYEFKDLMSRFIQTDAEGNLFLEENLKTAIAAAAMSAVHSLEKGREFDPMKEVNRILRRDEDTSVTGAELDALVGIGSFDGDVALTAGREVLQMLGLKAHKDAPKDAETRLASAFGGHVLQLLLDSGMVVSTKVSAYTLEQLKAGRHVPLNERARVSQEFMDTLARENPEEAKRIAELQKAPMEFIGLPRLANQKLDPQSPAGKLVELMDGDAYFLANLLGAQAPLKEPSLSPVKFVQQGIKNSLRKVGRAQATIMQKENSSPNTLRPDTWAVYEALGAEMFLEIAGAQNLETAGLHVDRLRAQEAKNNGLQRELEGFVDFVMKRWDGAFTGAPIYLPHRVWNVQRVGVDLTVGNPQASKIVRRMLTRPDWKTTIDPKDPAQLEVFLIAVAEGLGVKVDRNRRQDALADVKSLIASPKIQAAVEALRQLNAGSDLTDTEKAAIRDAAVGEGMGALDALMALAGADAKAIQAITDKTEIPDDSKPFDTLITMEVDGVANGPILSLLLLGAGAMGLDLRALANRGGFFENGSAFRDYNNWRAADGNQDLYETLAGRLMVKVAEITQGGVWRTSKAGKHYEAISADDAKREVGAIWTLTGPLKYSKGKINSTGRNFVKTPLTAPMFGASLFRARGNTADKFIEAAYKTIEAVARGDEKAPAHRDVLNALNLLLQAGGAAPLSLELTPKGLLARGFHPTELNALGEAFNRTVGAAVMATMEESLSNYMGPRDTMIEGSKAAFTIYNTVREHLRTKHLEALMDKGVLEFRTKKDGTREPIRDLRPEEEAELNKLLASVEPKVHTPFSKLDDDLDAGLTVAKTNRGMSNAYAYSQELRFAPKTRRGKGRTRRLQGEALGFEAPGVGMLVKMTHSLDSFISHLALTANDVLNVHDAHVTGLKNLLSVAQNLNHYTAHALVTYNPLAEMADALSRTLEGVHALVESGALPKEIHQTLNVEGGHPVAVLLELRQAALQAEAAKGDLFATTQAVSQYAAEGGSFNMDGHPEGKRLATIAKKRADAARKGEHPRKAAEEKLIAELNQHYTVPLSGVEVLGGVGEPKVKSDPALVKMLSKGPIKATELVAALQAHMAGAKGNVAQFRLELLGQLAGALGDVTVKMVTPDMSTGSVLAMPNGRSFGWYISKDGKKEIYVLSPEFAASGITAEMLVHELVHGAVADLIATELAALAASEDYTSEALTLIQELDALRLLSRDYAAEHALAEQFSAPLNNLQEFVAHGMSDVAFQTQILTKVQMPAANAGNSLVNGIKAFAQRLIGLIFKGSDKSEDARLATGMAAMITRVSALVDAAKQRDTQAGASVNLSMANPGQRLGEFTAQSLHEALDRGNLSSAFDAKLRTLLFDITTRLGGPFGAFRQEALSRAPGSLSDVWANALQGKTKSVLAKDLLTAPFSFSEREAHAMEQVAAVTKHIFEYQGNTTSMAYRQLEELFKEMRDTLTPADLGGQDEYDFLFGGDVKDGGHLIRFAAFGLANEQIANALKRPTKAAAPKAAAGFGERLETWFLKALAFFQEKILGTYQGQPADKKLEALMDSLVGIEARRQAGLLRAGVLHLGLGGLDAAASSALGAVKKGVVWAADTKLVKESRYGLVKLAGTVAKAHVEDRVEGLLDSLVAMRNAQNQERHGILMGMFSDVRGHGKLINALSRAFTVQQRDRKHAISSVKREVLASFAEGTEWTGPQGKAKKEAITQVLLRTGAHLLTDKHSLAEIEGMLGDQAKLTAAIQATEAELRGLGLRRGVLDHYLNQANALGYFSVTGVSPVPILMRNAHNIARLFGTNHAKVVSPAQAAKAEPVIARLVALRALGYTQTTERKLVAEIMASEAQRADGGNGAQFVLGVAKRLEAESRDRLFQGQESLLTHGYTAEIYDPNVTVEAAPARDEAKMLAKGFEVVGEVGQDPADPFKEPVLLFAIKDGGLARFNSGVLSTTDRAHAGSTVHKRATRRIAMRKSGDLMTGAPVNYAAAAATQKTFMVPVMNPDGEVTQWVHMMADSTKNRVLRRTNDFDQVMGAMAGSIIDKATAPEMNRKAIQALKDAYDAERTKYPGGYVRVGPKATKPELIERWAMLPKQTQDDILEIWGEDGMLVRREAEDAIFGFRDPSVRDMFEKEPRLRNFAEKLFVEMMEGMLGPQAAIKLVRGERMVQEVVREAKDIIVVRTGLVAFGNALSNLSLLWLQGVPVSEIIRGHLESLRGLRAYNADQEELDRLKMQKATGQAGANVEKEIARLEAVMAHNPVHELVGLGLLPTIVEDVAEDDDPYAYKTELVRKVEGVTSSVPKAVKDAANVVYMGKNTALYKGLRHAVEVSDFMARYTLFKHMTTRTKDRLSVEDAAFEASEAFINYDIPMPRGLQYTDSVGITMFYKYFLRIQRVLLRTFKDHPGRVLSMLLADHFLNLGPIVLDSSWMHKVGNNPLSGSALEYLGALDNLATINAGTYVGLELVK